MTLDLIKIQLNKNETVCDLSQIILNQENLEFIETELKNCPNIGYIKFDSDKERTDDIKSKLESIEKQLISNNNQYQPFTNDYIHCLLCSHCYETELTPDELELLKNKNLLKSKQFFQENKYKLLNDEWKVKRLKIGKGFKNILYMNKRRRQLVLAFQGVKLKVKDFFTDNDQIISSAIYSMIANEEIAPQTEACFEITQQAIDICKKNNFSLSFTGYSFGAWLAEQAVYFSIKDFKFKNVKAVTFQSPGSYDYLSKLNESNMLDLESNLDLSDLNIVTYLSEPNFVNTCNQHCGKVYQLFTQTDHLFDANKFSYDLIEKISNDKIRNKLKKCYDKFVKDQLKKYSFFVNGFISLFYDGLNLILNEFDQDTGKPLSESYKRILKWPKIKFESSENFQQNSTKFFEDEFDSIVPGGELVVKSIKFCVKSFLKLVSAHLFNGITIIINLMIEILNGNLNSEQCLNYFQYNENVIEEKLVLNKNDFKLRYLGNYESKSVNLFKDIILNNIPGSVDHFLFNLFYHATNLEVLKALNNDFIEKQLIKLKNLYALSIENNQRIIDSKMEVEQVRFRLIRLLNIDKKLESFLDKLIGNKPSNEAVIEITNVFDVVKPANFTGRLDELHKIEKSFETYQFVYIYGRSGTGKSTLASKFTYSIKEQKPDYIIRWIDAKSLKQCFMDLAADDLRIDNKLESKELFRRIQVTLNKLDRNILFVIDNLIYDFSNENIKNDFDYLLTNFNSNIKFLITTKNPNISKELSRNECVEIELEDFNQDVCIDFIDLNLKNVHKNYLRNEEWKDLLKNCIYLRLPIRLNKLISRVNTKQRWSFENIKKYLRDEEKEKFSTLKKENPFGYEILKYLSYLNRKSISYDFIYYLMINKGLNSEEKQNKEDLLNESLNYLIENKEISINDDGLFYNIHETTQDDIMKSIAENIKKEYLDKIISDLNELISDELLNKNKIRLDKQINEYLEHSDNLITFHLEIENEDAYKNKNLIEQEKSVTEKKLNLFYKCAKLFQKIIINYDKALEYYSKSLEIQISLLPQNHPDIANSYNNISLIYYNKGENDKALEYQSKSLEIQILSLPPNHPDFANSYNNIGNIYYIKGENDKALEYYLKSLEIQILSLPPNHPDIATSYNNIGLIYYIKGENEKALEYYLKSLEIQILSLPPNHPDFANSYNNIGLIYINKGENDKALEYYSKSLEIRILSLPPNHPDFANSYNNIGLIYINKGENDKALEYYSKSLEIQILSLPPNHPDFANSYNNIGNIYYIKGENDKALEYYLKSLEIQILSLPPNHHDFANSYNNIGLIYYIKGENDKALEYYSKSLEI
jgi:Tfp pilus assembly protein PilF